MSLGMIALGVVVVVIIIILLMAYLSDPKDIQDEEAAAVEQETPEEREAYIQSIEERQPDWSEASKADPGDTATDTNYGNDSNTGTNNNE
jgi:hypothetical protein